jgi:hypothetical protein
MNIKCHHGRINHVADAAYAAGLALMGASRFSVPRPFYENTPIFFWDTPLLGASRIYGPRAFRALKADFQSSDEAPRCECMHEHFHPITMLNS